MEDFNPSNSFERSRAEKEFTALALNASKKGAGDLLWLGLSNTSVVSIQVPLHSGQ